MTAPELLVGITHPDDAAVYRSPGGDLLVQTVDVIAPIVNDARTFGRVAAANAVSDVYAMGGRPLTALNVVCFPVKKLPIHVLQEILAGALEVLQEAGALMVGGHSVADEELKFGLSVTGIIEQGQPIWSLDRAEPGDLLVLTKPLGTGVMNQALRQDAIDASSAIHREAVRSMITLNALPASAGRAAGVHAATDITGFGFLGHASHLARASGVTLELERAAIPFFSGVRELVSRGFAPARCRDNASAYRDQIAGLDSEDEAALLFDPQTSGGLLLSVPADRIDGLERALVTWPLGLAVVGRVVERGSHEIVLRR